MNLVTITKAKHISMMKKPSVLPMQTDSHKSDCSKME